MKTTEIKHELLSDVGMLRMVQQGIRGGITAVPKRYAEANNKYVTIAGHSTGHSRCRYLKGRFCLELIRAVNQFC